MGHNKIKRTQKKQTSGRDMFQTPSYATELLIPFFPAWGKRIWECAAGGGKIVRCLEEHGYDVIWTDINAGRGHKLDFLMDTMSFPFDCIITNPPYSLKNEFYARCMSYKRPFALLIPADYSGWVIDALRNGAQKIIPTRRIDFITPTGKSGKTGHTANYHSLWLTHGFGLGKTETFVELTNETKKENI